jgi:hypothetical protein
MRARLSINASTTLVYRRIDDNVYRKSTGRAQAPTITLPTTAKLSKIPGGLAVDLSG